MGARLCWSASAPRPIRYLVGDPPAEQSTNRDPSGGARVVPVSSLNKTLPIHGARILAESDQANNCETHLAQGTHLSHLSAWTGRLGIAISRLGILLVSLGFDRFPVKCAAKRSLDSALV